MPTHPLAKVFGFPANNLSEEAERYRNIGETRFDH
jgi:hypothetical protein